MPEKLKVMKKAFLPLFLTVFLSLSALAQVPVSPSPAPHIQFFSASGVPLANGKVFTYDAGTTNIRNTYIDSTGTSQNTDPIILDAGGFADIWLANQGYKFVVQDSNNVQQWTSDNITGYLGLLNLANAWTFQQTFSLPIIDLATDDQFVLGAPGQTITLDFPPPLSNITLSFPNTTDTMVGRATTDTLSNKTLLLPQFNGTSCGIVNGPATYICIANANPTGTTAAYLTKLINDPSQATIAATTDTSGIIGITVSGAGNTGTATIQQNGAVACQFDGATTAGDYVSISTSAAGQCHDAGTSPPSGTQVIGQVTNTHGIAGIYQIIWSGSSSSGPQVRCSDGSTTTVNGATTGFQAVKTCQFPSGALNAVGKSFRVNANATLNPAGAGPPSSSLAWSAGTTGALGTNSVFVTETVSAAVWSAQAQLVCIVGTAGATGSLSCSPITIGTAAGGGVVGGSSITMSPLDLTGPFFFGITCEFTGASASNTCASSVFVVEQLK